MYSYHQSNEFFTNTVSVFSNLYSVSWGFISEIKNTLQPENEIWVIQRAFTAKAEFMEHVMGFWL